MPNLLQLLLLLAISVTSRSYNLITQPYEHNQKLSADLIDVFMVTILYYYFANLMSMLYRRMKTTTKVDKGEGSITVKSQLSKLVTDELTRMQSIEKKKAHDHGEEQDEADYKIVNDIDLDVDIFREEKSLTDLGEESPKKDLKVD
ncbi:MAG: hypothetical protein MHMPM18_000641 [Marteilia pararefringens]